MVFRALCFAHWIASVMARGREQVLRDAEEEWIQSLQEAQARADAAILGRRL